MMPGVVGVLLALETLKIIVGLPNILSQNMLLIDGQLASVKKIKIRPKQHNCLVCSKNGTIKDVSKFDYQEFAG